MERLDPRNPLTYLFRTVFPLGTRDDLRRLIQMAADK
jgi:hypothetical protein